MFSSPLLFHPFPRSIRIFFLISTFVFPLCWPIISICSSHLILSLPLLILYFTLIYIDCLISHSSSIRNAPTNNFSCIFKITCGNASFSFASSPILSLPIPSPVFFAIVLRYFWSTALNLLQCLSESCRLPIPYCIIGIINKIAYFRFGFKIISFYLTIDNMLTLLSSLLASLPIISSLLIICSSQAFKTFPSLQIISFVY